jgi:Cu/Ag efflux protein CusF
MLRRTTVIVAALLVFAAAANAFETQGTIRKVDVANRTVVVHAGGQERTVRIADDAKLLDERGESLPDGLKSKQLIEGAEATLTLERIGGQPVITAIQIGRRNAAVALPLKESVGLKPLNEMSAADKYKGEDGGLYGDGKNEPPAAHRAAAKRATDNIKPLDTDGRPAADGKIGLVSISMSNATQEFSVFKQIGR